MPADAELLASLLAPIAGEAPAGRDLRYDPRYDKVKEARREDADLPQGGLATARKLADWPQVVAIATELLSKETKDLQLAAWLTEALLRRQGLGGLSTGIALLKGLLDAHWEGLFPELEDGDAELRAGPLEWVGGRLDLAARQVPVARDGLTWLDQSTARLIPSEEEAEGAPDKRAARAEALEAGRVPPEKADASIAATPKAFYKTLVADVAAAIAALDALEVTADARFAGDAPSMRPLRIALEDVQRFAQTTLARKLEEDPDPVEAVAEEGMPGAVVGADGSIPIEPASAADAAARIGAAARWLRAQDATSPAPYLLVRGLRWGELRRTPGELDVRLLEAPPTAVRQRLKGLLLDGSWSELLEHGEGLMASPAGRGWLDLQRYVLRACAELGGEYDGVAAAIRSELRALLAAVPTLPETMLMDDTPTANPETQAWLADEGLLPDASAETSALAEEEPAGEDTPLGDGSEALDAALEDDEATAQNGGLARAVRRHVARNGSDPFARAQHELRLGRPNRAVELLVAELARERSPRGRFVRQTQIAYVMVEAGLDSVAKPILERLVAVVDERNLEDWESGPLVAQPMALLCRVIDRLDGDMDTRAELYLRVCRLDPIQAIALRTS